MGDSREEGAFSTCNSLKALIPIIRGLLFSNTFDIRRTNCYVQGLSTDAAAAAR